MYICIYMHFELEKMNRKILFKTNLIRNSVIPKNPLNIELLMRKLVHRWVRNSC